MAGLDEVLGGGFPRDRLFLVQGDPGVGKTTLALQFIRAGAAAGERGLYITLAESKDELETVAHSHRWTLDNFELFELQTGAARGADDDNTLFHPADIELTETTAALLEVIDRVRPDRVVFDSLSELRLLAQSPLRYRRNVLAIKQHLAGRNVTVLMLDDRTAHEGDEQLQSIAHGVLLLDQLAPLYGGDRRRLRVAKIRGVRTSGGYHDFTIHTGGLRVFPRLVAADDHAGEFAHGRAQSGVTELDTLFGGGIDRGSSVVFMGPPGSGKSIIGLQFAVAAAARGENAAVFVFDETKRMVELRAAGVGLKLDGHPGRLTLQQIDPAEMSPGEFTQAVRDAVEKEGVRLVVIDSLNGYLNAMPEEQFLSLQLHELLAYLSQRGVVTILILAQAGVMGHMQTPVDISYLADAVVLLRYFETAGHLRRALSVLKRRGGSHETTIRELELSSSGVRIGPALTQFHGVLTGVPQILGDEARGNGDKRQNA